ncbi:hypothetical protein LEP3755_47470 [Leptolyngbya sp. NIES-3755]|nr:hypothetical protein LEP3755_47470 [Leptolyngbya sp. NIES-3755]
MPTVNKANGLLAEFAIVPTDSDNQSAIVDRLIQNIMQFRKQLGFIAGTVFRSRDGLRATSYIQWADEASYVATNFESADIHLFDIFGAEPDPSELKLSVGMEGLINFGIFKMKQPENQARFLELFTQALQMVSGQPGLISTHAHRSLDGQRCINFGHWRSLEDYAAMDGNRPFSPVFGEMLDLADNEYQRTLHEVVFTT